MNPIDEINNQVQEEISFPKANLSLEKNRFIHSFKNATPIDWEDWTWQVSHRIRTKEDLSKIVDLMPEEIEGIEGCGKKLTMAIPPYFASLIDSNDPNCPIRRQCIPVKDEFVKSDHEFEDPCAEDKYSPVPGLVHRYPDRVLFLVSEMCAMYCRHCTRSRIVGEGRHKRKTSHYEDAYRYIRSNKEIRDVLISGGDPLMLSDETLEDIIKNIKSIDHVEIVRIGTRAPVTLPQRITSDLVLMLKKYSPIWVNVHFNHPKEVTKRVRFACDLLSDGGIPLGSQTVLLKGINDQSSTMKKLMHELLKIRVRPYYIYQCDPIVGSSHFRTSIQTGIDLIDSLRGHTTGFAVPKYVVDAACGGGKISIESNSIISKDKNKFVLKNFTGEHFSHYDPK